MIAKIQNYESRQLSVVSLQSAAADEKELRGFPLMGIAFRMSQAVTLPL